MCLIKETGILLKLKGLYFSTKLSISSFLVFLPAKIHIHKFQHNWVTVALFLTAIGALIAFINNVLAMCHVTIRCSVLLDKHVSHEFWILPYLIILLYILLTFVTLEFFILN